MPGIINPSANFSRPANTTAYASGDLVANSTTAGSVTPLSFSLGVGEFRVLRARIKRSQATATNASFRLHLYAESPSLTNGDNDAWLSNESGWLGFLTSAAANAVTFSNGGAGIAVWESNTATAPWGLHIALGSGTTIYGLLEARAAYTPASGETFTVTLEAERL